MAVEKNNEIIGEEAQVEEITEQPDGLPPEVMVEGEEPMEERPQDDFNANLAINMDERTLKSMANELIDDYKKDKISRKDWEDAYIKGLDLLGTKYLNVTRPFKGASMLHTQCYLKQLHSFKHRLTKNLCHQMVL